MRRRIFAKCPLREEPNKMKETYIRQVKQELSLPKKKKRLLRAICAKHSPAPWNTAKQSNRSSSGWAALRSFARSVQEQLGTNPCAWTEMAQLPIHHLAPCRWHRTTAAGNRTAPEPWAAKCHWPGERANANPGARARHRSARALPDAGLPLLPRDGACSGTPSPSQA